MAAIQQDAFFSSLFQTGMSDPNSKVYLPTIILQTSNPSLNPYTMSSLNLGNQDIGGVSINVLLTNLAIGGIANVSVAPARGGSFSLQGLNATMVTQFGTLSPPPPGVSASLNFTAKFTLSFSNNQLTGNISVSINQASLTTQLVISGTELQKIVMTLNSATAAVPSTATVAATVSFDGGQGGFWSQLFQNFLQKPSTVAAIVGQINEQLNAASMLTNLSTELTTIFQNAIQQ